MSETTTVEIAELYGEHSWPWRAARWLWTPIAAISSLSPTAREEREKASTHRDYVDTTCLAATAETMRLLGLALTASTRGVLSPQKTIIP